MQPKQKKNKKSREKLNILLDIIRQIVYIMIVGREYTTTKQYQSIRKGSINYEH